VLPEELRLKSHIAECYGKSFIPDGMTIQDFGVSYQELEPISGQFERAIERTLARRVGISYPTSERCPLQV